MKFGELAFPSLSRAKTLFSATSSSVKTHLNAILEVPVIGVESEGEPRTFVFEFDCVYEQCSQLEIGEPLPR